MRKDFTRDPPDWLLDFGEERHKETLEYFTHYIELLESDMKLRPWVDEDKRFVDIICKDENCPIDITVCSDPSICYFFSIWLSYHYYKYRFTDRDTITQYVGEE